MPVGWGGWQGQAGYYTGAPLHLYNTRSYPRISLYKPTKVHSKSTHNTWYLGLLLTFCHGQHRSSFSYQNSTISIDIYNKMDSGYQGLKPKSKKIHSGYFSVVSILPDCHQTATLTLETIFWQISPWLPGRAGVVNLQQLWKVRDAIFAPWEPARQIPINPTLLCTKQPLKTQCLWGNYPHFMVEVRASVLLGSLCASCTNIEYYLIIH